MCVCVCVFVCVKVVLKFATGHFSSVCECVFWGFFRSSTLFISSVAANGTFHFFLKMGRVFSFSSNFALILEHLPRPAENNSGKLPFSFILFFSASDVMHSTFWQNVMHSTFWLISEIKFLKPVRPKQIFCVHQYEDF